MQHSKLALPVDCSSAHAAAYCACGGVFDTAPCLLHVCHRTHKQLCPVCVQVYFMVDFRHDAACFFFYFLMSISSLMMFTSFGFFLVCATPMVELAQLFSSAINFLFVLLNGFTLVRSAIPAGWQWANRVVPPTWMIYGL